MAERYGWSDLAQAPDQYWRVEHYTGNQMTRPMIFVVCKRCGAQVGDLQLHADWHAAARGEGDRPAEDEPVDSAVVWSLILLVKDEIPRGLSVTEVITWDQPTLEAVADWCSAVHLRASDNDGVIVPPLPAILRSDTTWTADDDRAAGAAGDDRG